LPWSPAPPAASGGPSRALAASFDVVVNYARREADAAAVVAAIETAGGTAMAIRADVSRRPEVDEMFASVDARFGRLDALVNNAGIGERIDAITDIDDDAWRRTLAVNLDGAFFCLRAAIPRLAAHYAASKAGMLAFTAKAARELAPHGIAVNAVLPSVIETEMLPALARDEATRARLRAQFPIGRFGEPEEVAAVVRFLCESATRISPGSASRCAAAVCDT
jgi:3-oxoacyl-[acyl-carrier protein] reductase